MSVRNQVLFARSSFLQNSGKNTAMVNERNAILLRDLSEYVIKTNVLKTMFEVIALEDDSSVVLCAQRYYSFKIFLNPLLYLL